MNPLLLSALISAIVSSTMGFGVAWQWQGYRMDSYKLEVTNEQLATERSGRQALADAQAKVASAQAAAQVAADRLRRDAGGAVRAADGMRDALGAAVRSSSADLEACTRQVGTISELLTASTTAYRELAVEADQWADHAVALQSAWPK